MESLKCEGFSRPQTGCSTNEMAPETRQRSEALKQPLESRFSFPSIHSVKGRVLGALIRGERITHKDCWIRFGSSRLSHHVLMLRKAGWPIDMTWEDVSTSDAGRIAQIGRYWLPQDVISAIGECGQLYASECNKVEADRRGA